MIPKEINPFYSILIRTTKNIKYLVAPPGATPDPHGVWYVIGNVGRELLVSKESTVCLVPVSDIYIIGKSPTEQILEIIDGKEQSESE